MAFAAIYSRNPNVVPFYNTSLAIPECLVSRLRIMFVRKKPLGATRTKVQIVTSVRDGPKVRQRVIRHVGTATSEVQLDQLMALGRLIIEEIRAEASPQPALFSPRQFQDLLEQARIAQSAQTTETDSAPLGVDLAECREDYRVGIGVR